MQAVSVESLGELVTAASLRYPRFAVNDAPIKYAYGTAGFRTKAEHLDSATLRVGILAALHSAWCGGVPVGVMITASHNPDSDNGAKIMDHRGEMIAQLWEDFASELANVEEGSVWASIQDFCTEQNIDPCAPKAVFVGRDTRSSSERLRDIVVEGVMAMGGVVYDHGLVTTPQLHWVVRSFNNGHPHLSVLDSFDAHMNVRAYHENLVSAFMALMGGVDSPPVDVHVDCANGIGATALRDLSEALMGSGLGALSIHPFNTDTRTPAALNNRVGAEHVQKTQTLPQGVDEEKDRLKRLASVDGDADRLVYYYVNSQGRFHLLDGDKIIALVGGYINELVHELGGLASIGVVQTAYANGASTAYITETLRIPVACVPTGVKHLHHRAAEFDVGIYFEANGHGTVLISDELARLCHDKADTSAAARKVLKLMELVNQAVGDAISDMLLVELVLAHNKWTLEDWNGLYTDLPSYQSKVSVRDRTVVKTIDAERRTTAPAGLQDALDKLVSTVEKGRAFVRPSGTEDVVRVYAEAASPELARHLGTGVEALVREFC